MCIVPVMVLIFPPTSASYHCIHTNGNEVGWETWLGGGQVIVGFWWTVKSYITKNRIKIQQAKLLLAQSQNVWHLIQFKIHFPLALAAKFCEGKPNFWL